MPASAAAVSCALAASKRANAALTSATSDSDRVSVLVRPPWVYVNAGLSCGSPAAQWQVGLPHLRRNVVRVPRSNQSLPRRGSVDIAHPLCRCISLQRSPPQRKLELRDHASVRASRRRQSAQQDVPSEEPHPNDFPGCHYSAGMNYGFLGKFSVQPDRRDDLVNYLLQAAKLLEGNPGCIHYIVSTSEEPEAVWVSEVWTSVAAHDASLEPQDIRALIQEARPLITGMSDQTQLTVHGGKGLPS